MPHLDLTQEELDRRHPSLVPPDDEQLDDLANDNNDVVYQKGLTLAEEIRSETSLQGRMRRPLIALLQEEQQRRQSSKLRLDRTSTIRPFGGGVLSEATTSVLLPLTAAGATTTYNYDGGHGTDGEVAVGAVGLAVWRTGSGFRRHISSVGTSAGDDVHGHGYIGPNSLTPRFECHPSDI